MRDTQSTGSVMVCRVNNSALFVSCFRATEKCLRGPWAYQMPRSKCLRDPWEQYAFNGWPRELVAPGTEVNRYRLDARQPAAAPRRPGSRQPPHDFLPTRPQAVRRLLPQPVSSFVRQDARLPHRWPRRVGVIGRHPGKGGGRARIGPCRGDGT